jgi:hypothetical protein
MALEINLNNVQAQAVTVDSNTAAALNSIYYAVATCTFTDPTPAEGKGFVVYVRNGTATIGGTAYVAGSYVLRVYHSGAWSNKNLDPASISSGLTIGTTAITSGTVGRILFEGSGNVVQQDSTLFWDNINKRLGIGAAPDASTRLDVRAQGALSTDIAFRVRNSANTRNILQVNGTECVWSNGISGVQTNTTFGEFALDAATAFSDTNTAFGYRALSALTSAGSNVAVGADALLSATVSQRMVAVGTYAGISHGGSTDGVLLGYYAGRVAAFSAGTVAIGSQSAYSLGNADYNTMIGFAAGYDMTSGTRNTILGARPTTNQGITTGSYNTIVGVVSGLSNPSNNVILADGQGNQVIRKDANHNQILGAEAALATTATNGFTYIPTCAGTPTGTPTAITGKVPIVADTTNNKLYVYLGGAWVAMN